MTDSWATLLGRNLTRFKMSSLWPWVWEAQAPPTGSWELAWSARGANGKRTSLYISYQPFVLTTYDKILLRNLGRSWTTVNQFDQPPKWLVRQHRTTVQKGLQRSVVFHPCSRGHATNALPHRLCASISEKLISTIPSCRDSGSPFLTRSSPCHTEHTPTYATDLIAHLTTSSACRVRDLLMIGLGSANTPDGSPLWRT